LRTIHHFSDRAIEPPSWSEQIRKHQKTLNSSSQELKNSRIQEEPGVAEVRIAAFLDS